MAKSEKQFKMIRDQRYEEISDAALKIFARKGFAGTKISDITSSINLSHGLLYHYFKSKEEIYVAIIMNILDQFKQAVAEAEDIKGTPYDKLNWFSALTFSGSPEVALDRHILINEALQADFLSEEIKQNIRQEYADSLKVLSRIISAGQRDGIFIEGDEMELAAYYLSFSQGLTLWNAKGLYRINVTTERVIRPLLANP